MKSGRELWKWRGYGKRGKPKAGFPLFPQPLGNLAKSRRDSHIPTAPATTPWKSGKPKAGFPLSHRVLLYERKNKKENGRASPSALRGDASRLAASKLRTKMSVVDERKDKKLLTDVDQCSTLRELCVASLRR